MKHSIKHLSILINSALLVALVGCGGTSDSSLYKKQGSHIDLTEPTVVISDQTGMLRDMTFPDILSTELLSRGVNLMDRSTLEGLLKEKGLSWDQVISGQQYLEIGASSPVKTIIIVNAQMVGKMVSTATCRVLDSQTGELLMSMNVTNPQPYSVIYLGNKSTSKIAKEWANGITGVRR